MSDPTRPSRAPEAPDLSADRLSAMFAELDAQTKPGLLDSVRSLPSWQRQGITAVVQLGVVAASLFWQGPRDDVASIALVLGIVLALGFGFMGAGLRSAAATPRRFLMFLPWAILLPLLLVAPPVWPGMDMPFWDAMPIHIGCFSWSTGTATIALIPWLLFDRHSLARRWSTFGAAAAAGMMGFAVQMAVCPLISPEHKLGAHASSGVVIGLVLAIAVAVMHRRKA